MEDKFPKLAQMLETAGLPTLSPPVEMRAWFPDLDLLNMRGSHDPEAIAMNFCRHLSRDAATEYFSRFIAASVAVDEIEQGRSRFSPLSDPELFVFEGNIFFNRLASQLTGNCPLSVVFDLGIPRRVVVAPAGRPDEMVAEVARTMKNIPSIDGIEVIVDSQDSARFLTALKLALGARTPNVNVHLIGDSLNDPAIDLKTLAHALSEFIDHDTYELNIDDIPFAAKELRTIIERCDSTNICSLGMANTNHPGVIVDEVGKQANLTQRLQTFVLTKKDIRVEQGDFSPIHFPQLAYLHTTSGTFAPQAIGQLLIPQFTPEFKSLRLDTSTSHTLERILKVLPERESFNTLAITHVGVLQPSMIPEIGRIGATLKSLSLNDLSLEHASLSFLKNATNLHRLGLPFVQNSGRCTEELARHIKSGHLKVLDLRGTPLPVSWLESVLDENPMLRVQIGISDDRDLGYFGLEEAIELQTKYGDSRLSVFAF